MMNQTDTARRAFSLAWRAVRCDDSNTYGALRAKSAALAGLVSLVSGDDDAYLWRAGECKQARFFASCNA